MMRICRDVDLFSLSFIPSELAVHRDIILDRDDDPHGGRVKVLPDDFLANPRFRELRCSLVMTEPLSIEAVSEFAVFFPPSSYC